MPARKNTTTSRKNYYNWGGSYGGTWSTGRATGRAYATTASFTCNSPRYNTVKNECQWRMGSYQNVYTQFTGAGTTNWSPTIANRWVKYVNNGYQVYKFTQAEFTRHFGTQWTYGSTTATRRYLARKHGNCIKDVTKGKGNCWLIAATRTPTGRPFHNYNWK